MSQIEGKNPVLEALRSGRALNKILLSKDIERHSAIAEILHMAKEKRIPVEYLSSDIISAKSSTKNAQGVIAYSSAKGYIDIYDLMNIPRSKKEPAFLVILDGLEDPHNLGAILRTADATGVHGVLIPERRSVGLTETVAKVSAGAVEYVPVARINNLNNAIRILKEEGITVIGIEGASGQTMTGTDFKRDIAIVIGGEGAGISRLVKENCNELAFIPMKGKISSLNASVAAAVIMYEVVRQRSV